MCFTTLLNLPELFYFFVCSCQWKWFLNFLSALVIFVCGFCIPQLCWFHLLCLTGLGDSLGFPVYEIMSLANWGGFICCFPIWVPLIISFSWLISWAKTCRTMLSRRNIAPHLVSDLENTVSPGTGGTQKTGACPCSAGARRETTACLVSCRSAGACGVWAWI